MPSIEDTIRRIVREEVHAALEARPVEGVALGLEEAAAAFLGLRDTSAMRGLIRRREIAHVKIGRTTVIPREALERYVAERTIPAKLKPWGLTEGALRNLREGPPRERVARRTAAMEGRPRW